MQLDGRRRFPPLLDHAARGVFAALQPVKCEGGNAQLVGCLGIPRSIRWSPAAAHFQHAVPASPTGRTARPPYGVSPPYSGIVPRTGDVSYPGGVSYEAGAGFPASSATAQAAGFGDVDGDGDADLVVANNGANSVYLNDGLGTFRSNPVWEGVTVMGSSWFTTALALGDVNGDGTLDLILANREKNGSALSGVNQFQLLMNNGSEFASSSVFNGSSALANALALGDVNGDGALDLVVGNRGLNELFINNGSGTFSKSLTFAGAETSTTTAVALGDVDGDGALDIVFGINNGTGADIIGGVEVLLGDGAGGFSPQSLEGGSTARTEALALGDVNGDGTLDIIVARTGAANDLYLNGGTAGFTHTLLPGDNSTTTALALGDADGDGDLDLVYSTRRGGNTLLLNEDGVGTFISSAVPLPGSEYSSTSRAIVFGDVNGDGALDLFSNGGYGSQTQLLVNSIMPGLFSSATAFPGGTTTTTAVAIADFNGDADLDLYIGNSGSPSELLVGDGAGRFSTTTVAAGSSSTVAVAHGDVDGDGDLDIVTCQNTADNIGRAEVLLNDGAGSFIQVIPLHGSNASTNAVALGDVNGDGTLDIIVARTGAANDLFLNGGTAGFTHSVLPGDNSTTTTALALGDVDGDGDLDLISAVEGGNVLLLNLDGEGTFNVSVDAFNVSGGSSSLVSSLVTVSGGQYPSEVAWTLSCNNNPISGGGAPNSATLEVPPGTCTLVMTDTYGDGWNGAWWSAPAWIDADANSNDNSYGSYDSYSSYDNDNDGSNGEDGDDGYDSYGGDDGSCPDTPNVFPFAVALGAPNGHCSVSFGGISNVVEEAPSLEEMCSWTAQEAANSFTGMLSVSWTPPSGFGMDSLIAEMCPNSCGACNDGPSPSPSPSPSPGRRRLGKGSGHWAKEVVAKEGVAAWAKEIEADLPDAEGGRRLAGGRHLSHDCAGDGQAEWNPDTEGWGLSCGRKAEVTFTVKAGVSAAALAFGDVDADGDLDLIVAKKKSPNELWINNGSGVFNSRSTFEVNADGNSLTSEELGTATTAVALGDADGDGRLDVLVGNSGSANQLLLQQSDGSFVAAPDFAGGSAETSSVAFGDIDGDGELDLLVGNGGANGGANELLMLTHCPNGGAQLHAGSSCFACPPSMGKSSPSVCLECIPDFVSEGTDGTSGPGCRKACVLAQRPLGSDFCVECKDVPGNVWLTSNPNPNPDPDPAPDPSPNPNLDPNLHPNPNLNQAPTLTPS